GIFYSRYWAYDQNGLRELINEYKAHDVPLDTLITDMVKTLNRFQQLTFIPKDWHETFYKEAAEGKKDQAGQPVGWTGYTWDSHLFPTPDGFLAYCKQLGLRNTLNLHPASGVQVHRVSLGHLN